MDAEEPSLEQRRRRCAPQLSVGKEKLWRRVRVAGAGDGDGDAGAGGAGAGLAVGLWSESAAMRTIRGEERRGGRGGGGEVFKKAKGKEEEPSLRRPRYLGASPSRDCFVMDGCDG